MIVLNFVYFFLQKQIMFRKKLKNCVKWVNRRNAGVGCVGPFMYPGCRMKTLVFGFISVQWKQSSQEIHVPYATLNQRQFLWLKHETNQKLFWLMPIIKFLWNKTQSFLGFFLPGFCNLRMVPFEWKKFPKRFTKETEVFLFGVGDGCSFAVDKIAHGSTTEEYDARLHVVSKRFDCNGIIANFITSLEVRS